ncbi:MAG: transketolase [Planctomycetaceae bacterium]|nr:transketolase [Planctomycetaceae bacterium]
MSSFSAIDQVCVNTLRGLAIDAIEKAKSGHPGLPLGAAPMAYVLWSRFLKHDPKHPEWPDRDRFVLSAGHGSMLLYGLLHLFGYDLPMEELQRFRQLGSKTPGHPEFGHTVGVEATTGPLGQGFANAVGMAIAERYLAQRMNRGGHTVVDHHTYALVGDGDLMEGIASEAASLAGHLELGKLVVLYDANDISLDGPTTMAFTEDVGKRFEAQGWHVQRVADGDRDLAGIEAAIGAAREESARPSLVIVKTTIGFGSPGKAGTSKAHGAPLGAAELEATKKALGLDPAKSFGVPPEASAHFHALASEGAVCRDSWNTRVEEWRRAHPQLYTQWLSAECEEILPAGWNERLPSWDVNAAATATRDAGGAVLNELAKRLPWLFGGDADLSESTKTALHGEADFDGRTGAGRNLRYGVREHAMAGIANGIAYHGGLRTYTATFFCFADYMRPSMRLAAMNKLPVVYVFTHDSLAVGEDGPTHQPVEHLLSLRAIPNLVVLRPADANETREAWCAALERKGGPTALVLSRQKLPLLDRKTAGSAAELRRGAYVVSEPQGAEAKVVLIASGSEVSLALEVQIRLAASGVGARVVSMPSWELFATQDTAYRNTVLPPQIPLRVSIEAGRTLGWERWIGDGGLAIGVDGFGHSAPGDEVFAHHGLEAGAIAQRILAHGKGA